MSLELCSRGGGGPATGCWPAQAQAGSRLTLPCNSSLHLLLLAPQSLMRRPACGHTWGKMQEAVQRLAATQLKARVTSSSSWQAPICETPSLLHCPGGKPPFPNSLPPLVSQIFLQTSPSGSPTTGLPMSREATPSQQTCHTTTHKTTL